MKSNPYSRFINWTAAAYIQECRPNAEKSQATSEWLKAYGITAARVDAFLRLFRDHASTMPNALVLDVLELSNSQVRQTLEDEDLLDALLHTWSALAEVYGKASTPAGRELARLQLLIESGHALLMAQNRAYPARGTLLARYWRESEQLDLTRIPRSTPGFKDIGKDLEYMRQLRRDVQKRYLPRQAARNQRAVQPVSAPFKTADAPAAQRHGVHGSAYDQDRLPDLPVSRRHWRDGCSSITDGLFGNWRDHWDNTLP
ncbi:hypothetical protein [Paenarthrobacter aromaticivorans]|uniref:hypothetical protein n=1 Tax=Paenarthrobacter aromaticivorans TaxID=2849150 RepID=UPI003A8082A6